LFLSAELVYADDFSPVLDKVIKGKKCKLLMKSHQSQVSPQAGCRVTVT